MRHISFMSIVATWVVVAFLAAATAQAKELGKTKYLGKQVEVSTGHRHPGKCYYRADGGEWRSAPWKLCKRLGAKR